MLSRARWKRDKQKSPSIQLGLFCYCFVSTFLKSENKMGRLAMASFEQALRVRLSHQTEFDKRDNLTLLHMGLCLTTFGLFIFSM
ncbi:hypothetical protein BEH76_17960 [Shewanella algae]|nr:hypothetical protein BEH76_17960 [Shewanella algae]